MHTPSVILLEPLGTWFDLHKRDLPWRAQDLASPHPNPYGVLVSELMLQQTQVRTVLQHFGPWMDRFPNLESLSAANVDEVHAQWHGLGYYRRARHLQQAAQAIACQGWPLDRQGLAALPGLGPYASAAVSAIAFQRPEPAIDGNAFRVLSRLLDLPDPLQKTRRTLEPWLRPALEALGPSRMTQALMEFGARICTPKPLCQGCPLEPRCLARRNGSIPSRPFKTSRAVQKQVQIRLLAAEALGKWLLRPPESTGLLGGLWRWPTVEGPFEECSTPNQVLEVTQPLPDWVQAYTHRKESVTALHCRLVEDLPPKSGARWVEGSFLDDLPMGRRDATVRQALKRDSGPPTMSSMAGGLLKTWVVY